MDDEREIILIALSNSLIAYNNLLEQAKQGENGEGLELLEYIIRRHEVILQKYENLIVNDEPVPKIISRPSW